MFYDNYIKLCNQIKKSPSRVAEEVGTTRSSVNRWKNGSIPSDATALALAEYFHVPVEELLADKEKPAPSGGDGLDQELLELIELYKAASEKKRRLARELLELP